MSALLLRGLSLASVALIGLWFRTHDLSARPMHADEANQAVKLGRLLESGEYAFDPRDHHGPTLYYAAVPIAWIRGERTLGTLTETTVRTAPALAGAAAVLLLAALAAPLGFWPALAAAAFMALSPPSVYYSRYFVQETLLVAFTLGALVCAQHWWRGGRAGWALAAGACAGLMQATKISAPLFAAAALAALLTVRAARPASARVGRDVALAFTAALVIAALFYSSFGAHPAGLRDALAAYGPALSRVQGGGHEKPWWYYLRLFGWHREGGFLWEQVAFSLLALAGGIVAFATKRKFLGWALVYTLVVAAALSLTPYKTPWHAIHLVPGMAILAAGTLAAVSRVKFGKLLSAALVFGALAMLTRQTWSAVFVYPANPRNPYAYVHSSSDVLKFRALAEAALARAPGKVVRVIGKEYWPLPWYLRGLPRVGYWSEPPVVCDGSLVISSAAQAASVRARLHGAYSESFLGLRPDVLCVVFTPVP